MDPLSALALAGNVIQLLDLGYKLITTGKHLYDQGELEIHAQAAQAASDLRYFTTKLRTSIRMDELDVLTEDDVVLEELCDKCSSLAKQFIQQLDKLKVTEHGRLRKTLSRTLVSMWSKTELERIQKRLEEYRVAINSHVLGRISRGVEMISHQQSSRFDRLDQGTQQILTALLALRTSIDNEKSAQVLALTQLVYRRDVPQQSSAVDTASQTELEAGNIDDREIQEAEQLLRKAITEEVLQSLTFPTIAERLGDVAEAHQETLKWVFESPRDNHTETPSSNLVTWLRSGDGLYWINGKAGSGKSTLMKYVYLNPETSKHLLTWAKGLPCHTAGFFFWNGGTKMQKSQAGLLRSLLHEILCKLPDLVPIVLPAAWATRYANKTQLTLLPIGSWSVTALQDGFHALITQNTIPTKLCLFIDGLDEYEGNDIDMAKLFGAAAENPHIKICASSRPQIVFRDAFSKRPGLRLQDMTFLDIQRYVSDRLVKDERMQEVLARERHDYENLVNDIVTGANGVFLWVKLVVTSLLRGLHNHDRISVLQKRLRELPDDLERLYEHMLLGVEPVYQEEFSRLFQLVDASQELEWDWTELGPLTVSSLGMAMVEDERLVLDASHRSASDRNILRVCNDMDNLLRSVCAGLLEINHGEEPSEHDYVTPNMTVTYLHRTVRDFFLRPDIQKTLKKFQTNSRLSNFDPRIEFIKSYTLQLKADSVLLPAPFKLVDNALTYALRAEKANHPANPNLLDQIWQPKVYFDDQHPARLKARSKRNPLEEHTSFMSLAVQCGLNSYIRSRLATSHDLYPEGIKKPLLAWAVKPLPERSSFVSAAVVTTLLEFGSQPNRRFGILNMSPWQNALAYLLANGVGAVEEEWVNIIRSLLHYGADGEACVQGTEYNPNWQREGPYGVFTYSAKDVISVTIKQPARTELLELLGQNKLAPSWVDALLTWIGWNREYSMHEGITVALLGT